MYYVGIDIGGTNTKSGLVDESGRILETRRAATIVDDLNGLISTLAELILGFQKSFAVAAIGIGIPGLRSLKTRRIEVSPNIPCLKDVSLETLVADQVHVPVVTENDANAGAYAEFICGAGRGTRHMVYLTVGTGLGSGLILEGKLFRGASGYAGEFGHTTIEPGGVLCTCGNRGCLETVVSATAIVRKAIERGMGESQTAKSIFDAAIAGDRLAREVFEDTGRYLGIACANLVNTLNVEVIVIGGGVMASGDLLLEPARKEAARRAFAPSLRDCRIVESKLGPDAGVIGGAMLARDRTVSFE